MSGMGSVAETEDTPSLNPGGRYRGTGVRAACLGQLARHGLLRVGRRAAARWRRAPGSAAGMPGGSGHAMRQVSPGTGVRARSVLATASPLDDQFQGLIRRLRPVDRMAMGAQDRRCNPLSNPEALVNADLDTLATELYVRTDDLVKTAPERTPWRPVSGISPKITDAELVTLAVMQALLGYVSEARWLRYARKHFGLVEAPCGRLCACGGARAKDHAGSRSLTRASVVIRSASGRQSHPVTSPPVPDRRPFDRDSRAGQPGPGGQEYRAQGRVP